MRRRETWRRWYGAAVVGGVLVGAVPIGVAWVARAELAWRDWPGVWATSLGGLFTATAFLLGVVNYTRNSSEKRVERAMEFWRRSNEEPFVSHLRTFIRTWASFSDSGARTLLAATGSARHDAIDSVWQDERVAIEYLLDFYDEASASVLSGACDELAMYAYLGSLMLLHEDTLRGFIDGWRGVQGRKVKWDYLSEVARRWRERETSLDRRIAWMQSDGGHRERLRRAFSADPVGMSVACAVDAWILRRRAARAWRRRRTAMGG
ncbi:MAG: hypothetical protein AB7U23_11195 [Dehalococcoidia bacterium]